MFDRKLIVTVLGLTVLPMVYLAYPIYHAVRIVEQVEAQGLEVHQELQQIAKTSPIVSSHQPS
ncbi:MAG: hypothetical protein AAF664_17350 [Planctomycetota bacterium]